MATHIPSPHSTHPKTPPMPQEDIGSVLDRFQQWAGHQPNPVRELTYEEAVARSRRRSYAGEDTAAPGPATDKPTTAAKSKPAKSAQTGKGKSTKKTTAVAKPARSTARKTTKSSCKAAAKPSPKPGASAAHNTAASAYQTIQKATGEIVSTAADGFQQALAAHIHAPSVPLAVKADTKPVAPLSNDAPAVHLTVRLANEERDAIRERAHDLGITPSAYMRHCILEIDSLRVELETAKLAYAHASAAMSSDSAGLCNSTALSPRKRNTPENRPAEGTWITRIIRLVLPGKTKGQALSTSA